MNLKNIASFFEILNNLIAKFKVEELDRIIKPIDFETYNNYAWKGISIPIFKNDDGTYNIYFGLKNSNHLYSYEEKITSNSQSMFLYEGYKNEFVGKPIDCIKSVSEKELHYILFAYNMKYNVTTCDTAFDHWEDLGRENGHIVYFDANAERIYEVFSKPLVPPITIHIANTNYFLDEHLRGTRNNSFKYTPVVYNFTSYESVQYIGESRRLYPEMHRSKKEKYEDLKYNYMQEYQKYVDMLSYFIDNSFENPIETAYSLSYRQFEELKKELLQDQGGPVLTKK